MADSFRAVAKPTEPDLCTRCNHERYAHKSAGLCTGLGDDKAELGSFCGCASFQGPKTRGQSRSSTWTPPPRQERSGFTQSSSRYAIGDGSQVRRPNLQDKNRDRSETPDWVMFGIRHDGMTSVYASTSLSYLELRQEVGHFDEIHVDLINQGVLASTPWDLKGRMVDYVIVTAPTYREAIQMLFTQGWRPDGDDPGPTTADLQRQAALEEAQRAAEELERVPRPAIEAKVTPYVTEPDDDIVDAEIVEDD